MRVFVVIPAEGDSPETEQAYIKRLRTWYTKKDGVAPKILVFDHASIRQDVEWWQLASPKYRYISMAVASFISEHLDDLANPQDVEIHASGGFGALVAATFLRWQTDVFWRCFMIGGAPSEAMTVVAKIFHRYFVRLWYHLPFPPFFADDPLNDADSLEIKRLSTKCMQANPKFYRDQLLAIGHWHWQKLTVDMDSDYVKPEIYFVPNGKTRWYKKYWDNTYNNVKAQKVWRQYGVKSTRVPHKGFSFYNMMPAEELFAVMDEVRD